MKKNTPSPWIFGSLLALAGVTVVWASSGKPIPFTREWKKR